MCLPVTMNQPWFHIPLQISQNGQSGGSNRSGRRSLSEVTCLCWLVGFDQARASCGWRESSRTPKQHAFISYKMPERKNLRPRQSGCFNPPDPRVSSSVIASPMAFSRPARSARAAAVLARMDSGLRSHQNIAPLWGKKNKIPEGWMGPHDAKNTFRPRRSFLATCNYWLSTAH